MSSSRSLTRLPAQDCCSVRKGKTIMSSQHFFSSSQLTRRGLRCLWTVAHGGKVVTRVTLWAVGGPALTCSALDRSTSSPFSLGCTHGCLAGLSFPSATRLSHLLTSSAPGVCNGLGYVHGSRSSLTRPRISSSGTGPRRSTTALCHTAESWPTVLTHSTSLCFIH